MELLQEINRIKQLLNITIINESIIGQMMSFLERHEKDLMDAYKKLPGADQAFNKLSDLNEKEIFEVLLKNKKNSILETLYDSVMYKISQHAPLSVDNFTQKTAKQLEQELAAARLEKNEIIEYIKWFSKKNNGIKTSDGFPKTRGKSSNAASNAAPNTPPVRSATFGDMWDAFNADPYYKSLLSKPGAKEAVETQFKTWEKNGIRYEQIGQELKKYMEGINWAGIPVKEREDLFLKFWNYSGKLDPKATKRNIRAILIALCLTGVITAPFLWKIAKRFFTDDSSNSNNSNRERTKIRIN